MRKLMLTALLAAIAVPALPAVAKPHQNNQSWNDHQRGDDEQGNRRHDDQGDHEDRRFVGHDNRRFMGHDNRRDNREQRRYAWQDYNRYDYNRYDPRYGGYQADRYYRDGQYYGSRRLTNDDRIYRGSNGRYYCRRNDGTTGLIIGAIGGGLLGRAIAPNRSKTLGTILGGVGGALIGRSIGRDGVQCD